MTLCGIHACFGCVSLTESMSKDEDLGKYRAILMTNTAKILTETFRASINRFNRQNRHSVSHLIRYDRFFSGGEPPNQYLYRVH